MLSDFTEADRMYIACGYTDLYQGIDGLATMVQQQFQLDPFSNSMILFCGRHRDWIKALYWEDKGFVLLYKRLEFGSWKESEARNLTPSSTAGAWRAWVWISQRLINRSKTERHRKMLRHSAFILLV